MVDPVLTMRSEDKDTSARLKFELDQALWNSDYYRREMGLARSNATAYLGAALLLFLALSVSIMVHIIR